MKNLTAVKAHFFLDCVLLLSWGIMLSTLSKEGPLSAILHPTYKYWSFFCGVILLLLAFLLPLLNNPCILHTSSFPITQRVVIFLPILLALSFRSSEFSRAALLNRGLSTHPNFSMAPHDNCAQLYQDMEGFWNITPLDAWLLSKSETDRAEFSNASVSLIGQIMLPNANSQLRHPIIFRIWVNCCFADATPIGISISEADSDKLESVQELSWVHLKGKIHFHEEPPHVPELRILDLQTITPPTQKYLFR